MSNRTRLIIGRIGFVLLSIVLVTLCLCLGSCSGPPRPDPTVLKKKHEEVTQKVGRAKAHFAAANVKLQDAQTSNKKAEIALGEANKWVTIIVPALQGLVIKVPPELKSEVELMVVRMDSLSAEIRVAVGGIAETSVAVAYAKSEQANGMSRLTEVEKGMADIKAKYGPELFADMEKMSDYADDVTRQRNKILGLMAVGLAIAAAIATTRFVKTTIPATYGIPVGAFAVVYTVVMLWGRFKT